MRKGKSYTVRVPLWCITINRKQSVKRTLLTVLLRCANPISKRRCFWVQYMYHPSNSVFIFIQTDRFNRFREIQQQLSCYRCIQGFRLERKRCWRILCICPWFFKKEENIYTYFFSLHRLDIELNFFFRYFFFGVNRMALREKRKIFSSLFSTSMNFV